jgi:hypothetical protein
MTFEAAPVFEGHTKLNVFDFVNIWHWYFLMSFLMLYLRKEVMLNLSGLHDWVFYANLSVYLTLIALGIIALIFEMRPPLKLVKPILTVQIFQDRIVWTEKSENVPPKTLEERFDEYSSCRANRRDLFLTLKVQAAHVKFSGRRVSLIHRTCFGPHWPAVQDFVSEKVASANRPSATKAPAI